MTPFSPTIRVSLEWISPRSRPLIITVPVNVYLPSISDASSMNALSSPVPFAPFFPLLFHIGGAAFRWGRRGGSPRNQSSPRILALPPTPHQILPPHSRHHRASRIAVVERRLRR